MTDRQTANPGQYKAVVSVAELAKMQNGEEFVLHLTRDDHPLTEGTPYNKESVLPDELAAALCPDIPNPTPADALAALLPLLGGTMKGSIAMGGNKITGLADATDTHDAVNLWGAHHISFSHLGRIDEGANIDGGGRGMYLSSSRLPLTIAGVTIYNGFILSFQTLGSESCVQIAFDGYGKLFASRTRWYSNAWSEWNRI